MLFLSDWIKKRIYILQTFLSKFYILLERPARAGERAIRAHTQLPTLLVRQQAVRAHVHLLQRGQSEESTLLFAHARGQDGELRVLLRVPPLPKRTNKQLKASRGTRNESESLEIRRRAAEQGLYYKLGYLYSCCLFVPWLWIHLRKQFYFINFKFFFKAKKVNLNSRALISF
jgi:hypothetical protein